MQPTIHNVRDLPANERSTLEHLLGQPLGQNQQLIIQVQPIAPPDELPDWCNVFEGLSDRDIAEIEAIALKRAELMRSCE